MVKEKIVKVHSNTDTDWFIPKRRAGYMSYEGLTFRN
jgi:hypothetical protein